MAGALVQSRSAYSSVSVASLALAFSSSNTASNALFYAGANIDVNSANTIGMSDSNSNTLTALDSATNAASNSVLADWIVTTCNAGANTVTTLCNQGSTTLGIYIAEISGVQNVAADKHAGQGQTAPGSGTDAVTTGSVTTTATDFALAVTCQGLNVGHAPTVGTGYTQDTNISWPVYSSTNGASAEWKASVAAGSVAGTFTAVSPTDDFVTVGVWLKESGGAVAPILMAQACL
jgi:hypothetical protein